MSFNDDHMVVERPQRVSTGLKLGYGIGDFAHSLAFNLPAFFLIYFYTDVFVISAAAAGMIIFFAKIWDATISPLMGYITDHTRSRWGNKRPFLILFAFPVGLSISLMLLAPPIEKETIRVVYAFSTFTLFCTLMTIITIPYGSLTADITSDSHERSVVSAYRMVFAILGTLISAGATIPLVKLLGNGNSVIGFRRVGILFGAVVFLFIMITFFSVRGVIANPGNARTSLRSNIKIVISNKPFLILAAGVFMNNVAINLMTIVVVYFLKYNLHAEHMVPVVFLLLLGTAILATPLFLYCSRRWSKKVAYNLGMGFLSILSVPFFIFGDLSIPVALMFFTAFGVGVSTVFLSPWSMIPDTVEYSEWKTGLRREGILYGFFQLAFKLSVAVPGMLVGVVLNLVGYVPNVQQGPEALMGIKALLSIIPLVFVVMGMAIISRFPIDDAMHKRMIREIAERSP